MQKWTQDQAVAFESARECIVHLMAVHSAEISILELQPSADGASIKAVAQKLDVLAGELRSLRLQDSARIDWIRREYGSQIRESMRRSGARSG